MKKLEIKEMKEIKAGSECPQGSSCHAGACIRRVGPNLYQIVGFCL